MRKETYTFWVTFFALFVAFFHFMLKERPQGSEVKEFAEAAKRPKKWVGKSAPDFEINTLEGGSFRLSERVGKDIIVINFFATWCGPCKAEMPELSRFYRENREKGFVLIGVDAGEPEGLVRGFIKELSVDFPVGIDRNNSIRRDYGVTAFPTTVFIGVDGKVALYEVGAIHNADIAFKGILEANLKNRSDGKSVSKEEYLSGLGKEDFGGVREKRDRDDPVLTGRAQLIARKMDCPCGCEQKVDECKCNTAKKIRKRLSEGGIEGKTDVEVIKELDREFCVKEEQVAR